MREFSKLGDLLKEMLPTGKVLACTLSKRRRKSLPYERVSLRPVELRGRLHYQAAYHYPKKYCMRTFFQSRPRSWSCR